MEIIVNSLHVDRTLKRKATPKTARALNSRKVKILFRTGQRRLGEGEKRSI
jgi:hypothetical protein